MSRNDNGAVAVSPAPTVPQPRRLHAYIDVAVVIVVLTGTNLIAHFTTAWANIVTVPIAAVILLAMVRRRGLSWSDLGLSPRHWRTGSLWALGAVGVVLAAVAIGAALPITRPFFLADRYATISGALIASMVVIPLQTAIPEELAFRGVLHGTLDRIFAARGVFMAGSLLFGLWHIASSLGLTSGNKGLSSFLGGGPLGQVLGIALAVLATAVAGAIFTWLRRRSGSLLAPIAFHWAVNGAGALAAAVVWHVTLH
ncbi:CPBP family intramembrane metalloprotease [Nocardia otitidiscaviarum]|uniref:CPBP family intramembrane metalloprotease n=1 Tax=Nocardia otitidiscaviarum TaxID=1823 RepID=A0A516NSE8_9NOCA|nr:CPBP family intramembrane glutamic endopeptidase [Nocardia otitidiscaviarum]MCP9621076.1 CPBP family intramembrane metalloprotease [Nocardia otitidiscaviarum]QDP81833.1 CPBP family intramembrane metalloprotease [Nocardia otitidiscaviarum]